MPDRVDTGERCERHVGEIFPPRCYDCLGASAAAKRQRALDAAVPERVRYSTIECASHPGYFEPCDRCRRDAAEAGLVGAAVAL